MSKEFIQMENTAQWAKSSVLGDEKLENGQWWWLYSMVRITNATELCVLFKWQILPYAMYFITICKKWAYERKHVSDKMGGT